MAINEMTIMIRYDGSCSELDSIQYRIQLFEGESIDDGNDGLGHYALAYFTSRNDGQDFVSHYGRHYDMRIIG